MAASLQGQEPAASSAEGSTAAAQTQGLVPLRRAVYVHVSDLTSAYDIDHQKLEEELARVREHQHLEENLEESSASATPTSNHVDLDTSSYPQKRLQPPRGGYNLCVLVGNVNVVVDKKRVDGSRVRLAEVEVGDETGTVSLRARDDQIDTLREISDRQGAVVLRNCMLELYQGKHIRLAVTKWGKLSLYPDQVASTPPPPSKMNPERNFSRIDLSLVASEMETQHFATSTNTGGSAAGTSTTTATALRAPSDGGSGGSHPVTPPSKPTPSPQRHSQRQSHSHGGEGIVGKGKGRGGGRGGGGGGRQQRNNRSIGAVPVAPPPMHGHLPPAALGSGGAIHYSDPMSSPGRTPYGMHGHAGWHPDHHAAAAAAAAQSSYHHHYGPPAPGSATDTATQQFLLRQQYEMQQRQLHQMYHEERQRQMAAAASVPTGPSDSSHRQQQQQHNQHAHAHLHPPTPTMIPVVGSSPLLVPMSGVPPPPLPQQPQQQQQQQQQQDAPLSPNKMNPQAATFAPGHAYPPQQEQQQQQQQQHGEKMSDGQPRSQVQTQQPPAGMPMSYAAAACDRSHGSSSSNNNNNKAN